MVNDINNIKIWIETFGSNRENCIILISGAMAPATFWDDQFCEALSANHFVIRFDNRDYGYSTHFKEQDPPPYRIDDMVEDVKAILDYHEVESAHIVGHSLGGSIAQLFAVRYPQRVKSLIPISSPIIAKGDLEYKETPREVMDGLWEILLSNKMYQDYERGKDEFVRIYRVLNGGYELDMDMAYSYIRRMYETEYIKPHLNHTNIQKGIPDIYEALSSLPCQILFIYGESDYLPANAYNTQLLAEALANASCLLLKKAGHMFFNRTIWKTLETSIGKFTTSTHLSKKVLRIKSNSCP